MYEGVEEVHTYFDGGAESKQKTPQTQRIGEKSAVLVEREVGLNENDCVRE